MYLLLKGLLIGFSCICILSFSPKGWGKIVELNEIIGCWRSETSEDVICIENNSFQFKGGPKQRLKYSRFEDNFFINVFLGSQETLAASVERLDKKIKLNRFDGGFERQMIYFKVK